MKCFQRNHRDLSGTARPCSLLSALTLALAAGGCSADVGRFDFPSFNLNGDTGATSALPTPSAPLAQGPSLSGGRDSYSAGTYVPPSSRSSNGVEMGALPEPSGPSSPPPSYRPPSYGAAPSQPAYSPPRTAYRAPEPPPVAAPQRLTGPAPSGGAIEVQRGDTLYSLARANNVTVKELMAANGLTSPMIRPGQSLRLPGGSSSIAAPLERAPAKHRSVAAAAEPAAAVPRATSPGPAAEDWRGTYQVQSGDSLYRIARRHDVRIADLQRANSIDNPRALKPGMVLRVPGQGDGTAPAGTRTADVAPIPGATAAPRVIQSTTQPTMINGGEERRVAALDTGRATDAAPVAPVTPTKPTQTAAMTHVGIGMGSLRWPAKGQVL